MRSLVASTSAVLVFAVASATPTALALADSASDRMRESTEAAALDATSSATSAGVRSILRLQAYWSVPKGGISPHHFPIQEMDPGPGGRLSIEAKPRSYVGFDLKIAYETHQGTIKYGSGVNPSKIRNTIWTGGVDCLVHPLSSASRLDWYLGGGWSYYVTSGGRGGFDGIGVPVLRTGMDVALGTGRRWAFSLDIEKLFTTVFDDNQEVQLSPIEYGLGLAHRF